jgi:hypothetical protein
MTIERFLHAFPNVQLSADQRAYIRFLERSGKRFLIDFGLANCEQAARVELEAQLADRDTLPV